MLYTAILHYYTNFSDYEVSGYFQLYKAASTPIEELLNPLLTYEFSCEIDQNLDNLIDFFDNNIINANTLEQIATNMSIEYNLRTDIADSSNLNTVTSLLNNLNFKVRV